MKKSYKDKKAEVRAEVQDWQNDFSNNNYSYEELAHFSQRFERLGRKFGLLTEFRDNGIC